MNLKSIIIDLDLDNETKNLLNQNLGCARFIYNTCLSYNIQHYESQKNNGIAKEDFKYLSISDLSRELSEICNHNYGGSDDGENYEFLKNCNMFVLQQEILSQETEWMDFVKNGSEFPKFKTKRKNNTCEFIKQALPEKIFNNDKLNLTPTLINIPFCCSDKDREYLISNEKIIHSITITRTNAGNYTASIYIEHAHNI